MAAPISTRLNTEELPPGTVVNDRYETISIVGRGGFALVYKARQLNIERHVALKVLNSFPDRNTQESYTARFLQEAKAAAQIQHPNVVAIYDFGVFQDRPFIVMELLNGFDLKEGLRRNGAFKPSRTKRLVGDCLDALGKGHHKGIVHKDIKPGNLFIHEPRARNESLRVLDFGIARVQTSASLTQSQQVLGTPRYYAPEYVQHQLVTPALDVYQMGLIMVEMMTGEPLVSINDPFLCMMHHCSGQLPIPVRLLKSELGFAIARALSTDHSLRLKDGHAFRDMLDSIETVTLPKLGRYEDSVYLRDVEWRGGQAEFFPEAVIPGEALRSEGELTAPVTSISGVNAVVGPGTEDTLITPGAQRSLAGIGASVNLGAGRKTPISRASSTVSSQVPEDLPFADPRPEQDISHPHPHLDAELEPLVVDSGANTRIIGALVAIIALAAVISAVAVIFGTDLLNSEGEPRGVIAAPVEPASPETPPPVEPDDENTVADEDDEDKDATPTSDDDDEGEGEGSDDEDDGGEADKPTARDKPITNDKAGAGSPKADKKPQRGKALNADSGDKKATRDKNAARTSTKKKRSGVIPMLPRLNKK